MMPKNTSEQLLRFVSKIFAPITGKTGRLGRTELPIVMRRPSASIYRKRDRTCRHFLPCATKTRRHYIYAAPLWVVI